jgi:hypothetical protein
MTDLSNITLHIPGAHERNQISCAGIRVTCEECERTHLLLDGGWHLSPGDNGAVVYCDSCQTAEAQE